MTKSTGQNVLYGVKCIYAIKQHIWRLCRKYWAYFTNWGDFSWEYIMLRIMQIWAERLERQIDFLAQEEISPRVSRRRSFYWISGIAAAILGALFLIFTETNRPAPVMADTFTDPEEAAVVAQNALAFMSRNLNKGLGQVNEASQEITKINKIVNKHLND